LVPALLHESLRHAVAGGRASSDVLDELYAAPLRDFVARRNARAARLHARAPGGRAGPLRGVLERAEVVGQREPDGGRVARLARITRLVDERVGVRKLVRHVGQRDRPVTEAA